MLAYVTLATERLEPRERAELVEPRRRYESFDADALEAAAAEAGLVLRSRRAASARSGASG